MRSFTSLFTFLLIFTFLFIATVEARPTLSIDSVHDAVVTRIPGPVIFNPGLFPGDEQPGEKDPGDDDDDGDPQMPNSYNLDANDFFEVQYAGTMILSINGMEVETLTTDTILRCKMTHLEEGVAIAAHYVGIKSRMAGHYEVFFSMFDEAQMKLELQVIKGSKVTTYDLRSGSKIDYQANIMELVLYGGSNQPAIGMGPQERVNITGGEVTYVVEQTGDLIIAARRHPNFLDPTPENPDQGLEDDKTDSTTIDVPKIPDADPTDNTDPGSGVGVTLGGGGGCASQLLPVSAMGDLWIWGLATLLFGLLTRRKKD